MKQKFNTYPVLNETRLGAALLYISAPDITGGIGSTMIGFPAFLFFTGLRFAVASTFNIGELIPFPFNDTATGREGSDALLSPR